MKKPISAFFGNDSGTVAVYVALGLVVLLSCGALALDIGHMVSVKRELTKAAEAGALAGARGLWPQALWATSGTRNVNCDQAKTWALNAATSNKADGFDLVTSEVTVETGRYDYATRKFTPDNGYNANGVRVTTQKTDVQMNFAQIFGISSKDMSATATAIMDFVGAVGAGTIPIVLNQQHTGVGTGLTIYAGVATNDNGGWFTVPPDSAAASTLKDYINNPDHLCPALDTGETINLQNGQDTTFLSALKDLLNAQPASGNPPMKFLDCIFSGDTDSFNGTAISPVCPVQLQLLKIRGTTKCHGHRVRFGNCKAACPAGPNLAPWPPPSW
jgi:Flp pilus assembly protein TadG